MDLTFEMGNRLEPKGHAIVYFRDSLGTPRIAAIYVVVPPIKLELAKYVPPMLQGQMPAEGMQDISAIPLPPVPEEVESHERLQQLAAARYDDLIYGGQVDLNRVDMLLTVSAEVTQSYLQAYQNRAELIEIGAPAANAGARITELDPDEVLYGVLSNRERLGELAKLMGMARYAAGGSDQAGLDEARSKMEVLAEFLPKTYRMDKLITSSCRSESLGDRLSELYLDRCYKLLDEDYRALESVDLEIGELEQK